MRWGKLACIAGLIAAVGCAAEPPPAVEPDEERASGWVKLDEPDRPRPAPRPEPVPEPNPPTSTEVAATDPSPPIEEKEEPTQPPVAPAPKPESAPPMPPIEEEKEPAVPPPPPVEPDPVSPLEPPPIPIPPPPPGLGAPAGDPEIEGPGLREVGPPPPPRELPGGPRHADAELQEADPGGPSVSVAPPPPPPPLGVREREGDGNGLAIPPPPLPPGERGDRRPPGAEIEGVAGAEPGGDGPAPAGGWKDFRSDAAKFSAHFPGDPKESENTSQTPDGDVTRLSFRQESDDLSVAVHFADLSQPGLRRVNPASLIMGEKQGMLQATGGEVTDEKLREIPNRTELELQTVIDVPRRGEMTVRWVPRKDRLYTLVVAGRNGSPPRDVVNRFLDSFKPDD